MDTLSAIKLVDTETRRKRLEDANILLIAPVAMTADVGGPLVTMTVSSFQGLLDVLERRAVIACFDVENEKSLELLRMVVQFHLAIGVEPTILRDLPSAEYTVNFEHEVNGVTSVSFVTMIETAALSAEVELNRVKENETQHQRELRTATRKTGELKAVSAFDLPPGVTRDDGPAPDAPRADGLPTAIDDEIDE